MELHVFWAASNALDIYNAAVSVLHSTMNGQPDTFQKFIRHGKFTGA